MTDPDDEVIEQQKATGQEDEPENFLIDILTGEKVSATPKRLLVQKVLRQLIESYGFDRADVEVDYRHRIRGGRPAAIDIAIFRPGTAHDNEHLQRVVVCKTQRMRDKLRSVEEADTDLAPLKALLELIPGVSLGMWTNGQEEFLFQVERTRFEVVPKPLGVWPVPGERTTDLDRTGGVIQISAEVEDLEAALLRCRQYLNRNLGLDSKDTFKQLAVLMLAKIYDETLPPADRKFWIKGDQPFTAEGQEDIARRIGETITAARTWQPQLLARGWDLTLEPHQTARIAMELARFALNETQPRYRTGAFRTIARIVMDGREGRYPTPLNVAEMAVEMLDPKPGERVMDCSSGTGTFLAMTAVHIFKKHLGTIGTTPEGATRKQIVQVMFPISLCGR